jgi:hypothetical protein
MAEAREIEQTGSKIIDELLSQAREAGMHVKITEEVNEDGYLFWTAEFRIPVWGRVGSSLRQQQEYDNLRVIWMRPPGTGRRPRMLDATRRQLFEYKRIKSPKDMCHELHMMRRDAEKTVARLALRKGGDAWHLETLGRRLEALTSRPVTLEEAEKLVAIASELTAVLPGEIRFYQWDSDAKEMVRSALVLQAAAEDMPKRAQARAEGLIPDEGNYLVTREDEGGYVSRTVVQREAAAVMTATAIVYGAEVTSDGRAVTIAHEDGTRLTVRRTFDNGDTVTVNPGTPNEYVGTILRPARHGCFRVQEPQYSTACDHPAVDMTRA